MIKWWSRRHVYRLFHIVQHMEAQAKLEFGTDEDGEDAYQIGVPVDNRGSVWVFTFAKKVKDLDPDDCVSQSVNTIKVLSRKSLSLYRTITNDVDLKGILSNE